MWSSLNFYLINHVQLKSFLYACQAASGIILPIIKAEGVRQTFFPAILPAYYRTPPLQV